MAFPRTAIETMSVPRLIIGCNWFLGYSHTSAAKDEMIKERMTATRIADVLVTFMKAGVDAIYGMRPEAVIERAVAEAEQRAGRALIKIAIPTLPVGEDAAARDEAARILDEYAVLGVNVCMPHQTTTDVFVNRRTQSLAGIEPYLAMIRERGMLPGLSSHMPETPTPSSSGARRASRCRKRAARPR
jgi:hypothetical protein